MANNRIAIRRTTTPGKVPNTAEINTGELGINLVDRKIFTSNGSNTFELGANVSNQQVANVLFVGNSTVNTMINSTSLSISNSTYNFTANAGYIKLGGGSTPALGYGISAGNSSIGFEFNIDGTSSSAFYMYRSANPFFSIFAGSENYLELLNDTYLIATDGVSAQTIVNSSIVSIANSTYQTDILPDFSENVLIVAVSDETTNVSTGTAKLTFYAPFNMQLTKIPRSSLSVNSSSGLVTVDINDSYSSILGANKLSIDANEGTSTTATTPTTLSSNIIYEDSVLTIDIDAAGTGAKGLKVYLYYKKIQI